MSYYGNNSIVSENPKLLITRILVKVPYKVTKVFSYDFVALLYSNFNL